MKLTEIINFVYNGITPISWFDSAEMIELERNFIDKELQFGKKAYGFTSLFGPLDKDSIDPEQQELLLTAHLVGFPSPLKSSTAKTICAAKMISLSNGGSGISRATYENFLHFITTRDYIAHPISCDLNASYGSGDVVPASFIIRSIFGENYPWSKGDLIALINGNFISTGFSIDYLLRLIKTINSFMAHLSPYIKSPKFSSSPWLELYEDQMMKRAEWEEPPQLSVVERDWEPILNAIDNTLSCMVQSLETSLGKKSANPLFIPSKDSISANSQSSFLDFRLTFSIQQSLTLTKLISGIIQQITEKISQDITNRSTNLTSDKVLCVQYPKISEAYRARLHALIPPQGFTGNMSGGVENLWDFSLPSANVAMESLGILDSQLKLLDSLLQIGGYAIPSNIDLKNLQLNSILLSYSY